MPSWVECEFVVGADDRAELEEFVAPFLHVEEPGIFHHYLPCPEALMERDAPFRGSAEQEAELIARYGASTCLDWQMINWGIKWGDCFTSLMNFNPAGSPVMSGRWDLTAWQVIFTTQFPWGLPDAGLVGLSTKFPRLTFGLLNCRHEDWDFIGDLVIKDGEVLKNTIHAPTEEELRDAGYFDD